MKKFMLLSLFFVTSAYAQVGVGSLNERSMYDIGTGLSVSYFDNYVGVNVESIHLFRNVERPFDNAFVKIGMGANIDLDRNVGFNLLASAGYLYVQDQYHEKSILSKFGTGATVDFTYIDTAKIDTPLFGVGTTLYVVINKYFVGLGGGVIIPQRNYTNVTSYVNTSFAIAF